MNTRICSVIAILTLVTLSSGCSGMRNFLFGRGARCGLCNTLSNVTPRFGNTMQAPCGSTPYDPTSQVSPCESPAYSGGVVTAPGCGCNSYVGGGQSYFGDGYAMQHGGCGCVNDCGCGGVVDGYGPVVSDPYMSSGIVGGTMPYEGQIISDQVIGQQPMGQPAYPNTAPIQADDFSARKFDADGNKILWEEPLPQGSTAL